MNKITVGVAGCGLVGEALLSYIDNDPRIEVSAILVKTLEKPRKFTNYIYSNSKVDFLNYKFDAYVDVSDDHLASLDLLKTILPVGYDAVLCNKELLWTSWKEILNLANQSNSQVKLNSILSCSAEYGRPDVNLSIYNISNYSPEELYSFRGGGPEETALDIYLDIIKLIN
jgi:hypothetical protein